MIALKDHHFAIPYTLDGTVDIKITKKRQAVITHLMMGAFTTTYRMVLLRALNPNVTKPLNTAANLQIHSRQRSSLNTTPGSQSAKPRWWGHSTGKITGFSIKKKKPTRRKREIKGKLMNEKSLKNHIHQL